MEVETVDFVSTLPTHSAPRTPAPRASKSLYGSTIFHEPWWLKIVGGDGYGEAIVASGGAVVGRLPYVASKRFGLTTLGMPPLTYVLGPVLAPECYGNAASSPLKQVSIIGKLIVQLPSAAHVFFRLHGAVANTLAFDAFGFSNSASFTVEVEPQPSETIWRQMRDKTRNVIRRAEERLTIVELDEPERFLDFYEDNLRRRGRVNHDDRKICARIISACIGHDVGRILATVTEAGEMQSAIFTVWDHHAEYYLMSTRTATSMNGSVSLAIWQAIQHAAANGLIFDMNGLHVKDNSLPNMLLLTGFGGAVKPRYIVSRTSQSLQVARSIKEFSFGMAGRMLSSGNGKRPLL